MKVNKIDHICIAVKDLEEAKKVWEPLHGLISEAVGCKILDWRGGF